jgi:hypothetical protein
MRPKPTQGCRVDDDDDDYISDETSFIRKTTSDIFHIA